MQYVFVLFNLLSFPLYWFTKLESSQGTNWILFLYSQSSFNIEDPYAILLKLTVKKKKNTNLLSCEVSHIQDFANYTFKETFDTFILPIVTLNQKWGNDLIEFRFYIMVNFLKYGILYFQIMTTWSIHLSIHEVSY